MDRQVELLVLRATPLVFGIVRHVPRESGEAIVRVGGSGIFVAPFQALTGRNVARDLFRTDPARADDLNRRTAGYFELPHSGDPVSGAALLRQTWALGDVASQPHLGSRRHGHLSDGGVGRR